MYSGTRLVFWISVHANSFDVELEMGGFVQLRASPHKVQIQKFLPELHSLKLHEMDSS